MKFGLIASGIIIIALILLVSSFWNDSLIVDEIPHVGAGYSYVKALDYRLNPEHPPLAKALAGVPLLFLDLKQDALKTKFWLTDINGQWDFGRFLIFQSGNNAELITKAVKFPMLLFFVFSAILVALWAKKMYGRFGALLALALFSFSPTVMTHSRFVTTDIPALFGILLATFFFIRYLENQTRKNLWLAGIAFGIAILTKFSTFLLVPYFLILGIAYGLIQQNRKSKSIIHNSLFIILVFLIGFVFVVWPVYFLFTFNYPPERQLADTQFLLGSFGNQTLAGIIEWMADKPVIRALGQYGLGLLMVGQRTIGGNTVYFLGEVSAEGWKHYFPVVYFLKEPLAWWAFVFFALLNLAITSRIKNLGSWIKNHFTEFAMLLWLLIYWSTSIYGNLNIGVRHLLPVYPFTIILISGQIASLVKRIRNYESGIRDKFKKFIIHNSVFIIPLLLIWYVFESVNVWPYYLTYFNQLAGGPSGGYRYVVDSNLDWGQDLKRLSLWTEEKNINKIYLDYFGWSDPIYYLGPKFQWLTAGQFKNAEDFIERTGGGYLAVSGTFYMNSRENPDTSYAWLDEYKPTIVIGNSIFIWQIGNPAP